MALKDIIGQGKALNILKGCINKERIPHAIFFAGDEGIGKKLAAINFAKTLNCTGTSAGTDIFAFDGEDETAGVFKDACDKCSSCIKIDKGTHPDVFTLSPEGDGGQITVSAVRQLEESLSYKPFEGEWKIAIIDNADRLNSSASNAFLKTLEDLSASHRYDERSAPGKIR
jgi:DNA polymerase-3 subunit delta'